MQKQPKLRILILNLFVIYVYISKCNKDILSCFSVTCENIDEAADIWISRNGISSEGCVHQAGHGKDQGQEEGLETVA